MHIVCKRFFIDTFDIGEKSLQGVLDRKQENSSMEDMRGKGPAAITAQQVAQVFIKSHCVQRIFICQVCLTGFTSWCFDTNDGAEDPKTRTQMHKAEKARPEKFVDTGLPLNIIGRESCRSLGLSLDQLLFDNVHKVFDGMKADVPQQKSCQQLCREFPDLFNKELGTKDFQLEIKFKPDTQPVFHKPRPVPIAVQKDLDAALQARINKGIWEPAQFNMAPLLSQLERDSTGAIKYQSLQ
ncbi:hypothetical protein EGW08_005482 [Elysia chlorotica]|uniref:Uncharacterized protein n=1 Tax=Elysia chlorotica TaxID=188477 RepID=A0A433TYV2_ELYCH|nr:hypothetical protein EGW08_005482 [Elysia chlorotica]